MGADIHGNVAPSHSKGDVSPITSDTSSSSMSWTIPSEIPSHLPFRPTLTTQQSSSLPSTPYQQPRDLPFRSRSPSPNRSPQSVHSEFNHILPVRKQYGGCKYEAGMAYFRRRMPYSLGDEPLPDEPGPLKRRLEPAEDKKLTDDMRALYETLIPSAESESRRSQFVKKLEDMLNKQWPGNDIQVHVFGSSGNKLCTSSSDVDICITTPSKVLERVCLLADFLARNGMERVVCVSHAKVPIVKIWDPKLEVACDMNVNNTLALENTRMIKTYVESDERVRPLAMILKHWTKRRILNDAALGGTLSSYTWICLIINFLQTRNPPIVPNLQQNQGEKVVAGDLPSTKFEDDLEKISGFGDANKSSLGALLFDFFRYYGHEINYEKHVMSVREGKLLSKEDKGWHLLQNNRLCVEEPFSTTRNLGNTADDSSFRGLHQELRRAFTAISEGNLEKCCEQYEYPPEEERSWERPPPQPRPVLTAVPSLPSRGGRGGGRGARNNNSFNRGSHTGGRRSSNTTNRSNNPRNGNQAFPPEATLQAQHAQYLLHDHLYQQIQLLQAQEQELRMQQALIGRANQSMIRQPYLQVPVPQQEHGSPDEHSRSRAGTVNHPPLPTATRQQVVYSPSFVPTNVSSMQSPNTIPSSPSIPTTTPDLRRSHRRASLANGSPRGSLRAQSQPARPIPMVNTYSAIYSLPTQPGLQAQSYHQMPESPQRTPTEKDFSLGNNGTLFSRSTYFEESLPTEYGGYYVGDSPQTHNGLRRPIASSYPGQDLAISNGDLANFLHTPTDHPPNSTPNREKNEVPAHKDVSGSSTQLPPRPRKPADQGLLIVDGSQPANEYRQNSFNSDESDQVPNVLKSPILSQQGLRHNTFEEAYHELHTRLAYGDYDAVSQGLRHEQAHIALPNGWGSAVGKSHGAEINGNMERLETLSERLHRFQLTEPNGSSDSTAHPGAHTYGNNDILRYAKDNSNHGFGGGVNTNGTHAPKHTATVNSARAQTKEPYVLSPSVKRRANGVDSDKLNGTSHKPKAKGRQELSNATNHVPGIEHKEKLADSTRKPNGIHTNGAGDHQSHHPGGWQTTTKRKNRKGARAPAEPNNAVEPLPADVSLRKGG